MRCPPRCEGVLHVAPTCGFTKGNGVLEKMDANGMRVHGCVDDG